MLIGYARVSTYEQNLEPQLAALRQAGCEKVYQEKLSSTNPNRPEMGRLLDVLRAGDTLVVWKLDRLGRSVKGLIELLNELDAKGVHLQSLTDNIDTHSASGRFFFHVVASFAQMERELIVERTRAGLEAAKRLGRIGGRKRKMTDSKLASAKNLLQSGLRPKDVAQNLGVSLPTLYRWIPTAANLAELN